MKHLWKPAIALLVIVALLALTTTGPGSLFRAILDRTVCDTEYAPDFRAREFNRIRPGDTLEAVKMRIGEPLSERRGYASRWGYRDVDLATISFTFDRDGEVLSHLIAPLQDKAAERRIAEEIQAFTTRDEVGRVFGKPSWEEQGNDVLWLSYSRSPSSTHYWQYSVVLDPYSALVLDKVSRFYFD